MAEKYKWTFSNIPGRNIDWKEIWYLVEIKYTCSLYSKKSGYIP